MPVIRTDDDGSGYQVAPLDVPTGPDGDFRLLDVGEVYERVMLEDDASIRAAGDGWGAVGQRFLDLAADLRRQMDTVAEGWHADSATALAERVHAAAGSLETWGAMATARAAELHDLGTCVRLLKIVLEGIWHDFVAETGRLLTPPADLTLEQRQQWRAETANAPALEVTMRKYSQRALVEVVNPLANRYAEAALAFAAPGPRYGGPTNAARPSDRGLFALFSGDWAPDLSGLPGAPGTPPPPGVPRSPALPSTPALPDVPALPFAQPLPSVLAVPAAADRAAPSTGAAPVAPSARTGLPESLHRAVPALPHLPGGVPASLTGPGATTLAGRGAPAIGLPPVGVPAPPRVLARPPAAPSGLGVPAPPAAVTGRPAAPHLPPSSSGRRPTAPAPRLPGRTAAPETPAGRSAHRSAGPAPTVPGAARRHGHAPDGGSPFPDDEGLVRPMAPAGPQLPGRTAPSRPGQVPPPSTLGAARPTGQHRRRDAASDVADHGTGRVIEVRDGVHPALRAARPTSSASTPTPVLRRAVRSTEHAPTAAPAELRGPDRPWVGARPTPGTRSDIPTSQGVGARSALDSAPRSSGALSGRTTTRPAEADQRAADRDRRRAAWDEQRRQHRAASAPGW